jgi:hypothetical protein
MCSNPGAMARFGRARIFDLVQLRKMNINPVQANARDGSGSGKSCFVTGHDFSRADCRPYRISALAAAKAQLAENKYSRG